MKGDDVRFGSKADICAAISHVRFAPESGHVQRTSACPLCARSGHCVGSFDNFVGANVQRRRNVNAKRLRSPEVDDQLELGRPHDRKL